MFATYYLPDRGDRAMLGLNNSTRVAMNVNPTLYSQEGVGMPLPTVRLDPNQHQQIDLTAWIAQFGENFRTGSVQLEYDSITLGLGAQITVLNESQGIALDVPFRERRDFRSSRLEGTWWAVDEHVQMKVTVSNIKDTDVSASLTVTAADGATIRTIPLPLGPRRTRMVNLRDIIAREHGSVGGISIQHDGRPGAVLAHGFVSNPANGFSSALVFHDPGMAEVGALHGAGVYLPAGSGMRGFLLLRNASADAITADPVLRQGEQTIALGKLTLAPGASKKIEVAQAFVEMDDQGVGIEIPYSGSPGSLVGQWFSMDASGNLVVETPLRHPDLKAGGSGSNPFTLAGDFQSVAFVKNPAAERASFVGVIYHGNEKYTLGARFVEPGQTLAVDLRKLRDEQVPDVWGNVLPLELETGQFEWLRRSGPRMLGRVMILSRSKGMAMNMSCGVCPCSPLDVSISLVPNFVLGPVGGLTQITVNETDTGCDLEQNTFPIPGNWVGWSSTNPPVASPNASGMVTCSSTGTATVTGAGSFTRTPGPETPCEDGECEGSECPEEEIFLDDNTDFQVDPTVAITSALDFAFVGSDPTVPRVRFQAVGDPAGGSFNWTASNTRVSFDNATSDVVALTGNSPSTTLQDTTLTVQYTKNSRSGNASRSITVRIFRFLEQTGQIQTIAFSNPPPHGYDSRVFYRIRTNPGQQVVEPGFSGIVVLEQVAVQSVTVNGVPASVDFNLTTQTGTTNANSEIVDELRLSRNSPLPSGLDIQSNQDLFVGGLFVEITPCTT